MRTLKGSCLCGAVVLEVPDEFGFVGYCHCSQCQKWSGSAFASGGSIRPDALRFIRGEDKVARYQKSDVTQLAFCRECGSSLYSLKPDLDLCIIRLGILDDAPTQTPQLHIFAGSKAPWHDIKDDLPVYDTVP